MTKICTNCGRMNPDKALFCVYCGTKLSEKTVTVGPPPQIPPATQPSSVPSDSTIPTPPITPPESTANLNMYRQELVSIGTELARLKKRSPGTWLLIIIFGSILIGFVAMLSLFALSFAFGSGSGGTTVHLQVPIISLVGLLFMTPVILVLYWYYKISWELNFHNKHTVRLHNAELNVINASGIDARQIYLPPLNLEDFSPGLRTFLLLIPIVNIIMFYFLARDLRKHIDHHKAYYTNVAMALSRSGRMQEGQIIQYHTSKLDNIDSTLVVILLILISTIGMLYTLYKCQSILNEMWDLHNAVISVLSGAPTPMPQVS